MRTFAQMIANLRESENALYDGILETVGYITAQYHAGREVDGAGNPYWPQFISAIRTRWVADKVQRLQPKGKRLGKMEVETAMLMLAPEVSRILNERKAENVAATMARNKRKAEKKANAKKPSEVVDVTPAPAPEPITGDTIEGVATQVIDALVLNGTAIEITPDEAQALYEYLASLRTPKLLKAA